MRAQSVAARAALAVGVVVLGASCRPDRLTSPGADATDATTAAQLGAAWGSTVVDVRPDLDTLPVGSSRPLTIDIGSTRDIRSTARWSSLDSSVVMVSSTGVVTAMNGGTARVVGKVGPSADTVTIVVSVPVAGISVSPESGSLTVGQQAQLSATTTDALGRPVSGASIAWSSTNPSVATVSAGGVVTGVATGDAMVVASAAGKSDTASVRVSGVPVTSVAVAPTSLALTTGATGQLAATATSNGTVLTDRLTTWTSSDESIARVSSTGQVTAVGTGTATITATIDGQKATATVTAAAAPVASVTVSANAVSLLVGQTTQASATTKDASGAALTGRTVTWSTSDASVATVSSTGVVTAVAAGSVTITATSEGVKGTVTITVTQATVASVTVSLNATSIAAGQSAQATAAAFDASGQQLAGRAVTWTIAPTSVATISTSGAVTGVAGGTATVTATVEGKSGSATITVTTATPISSPPPSSGSLTVTPELPRNVVATAVSATPSPGATVRVPSGGDLQGALDRAAPGDVILLAAGGSYTGNFVLRAKPTATNSTWITIRTETTLPPEGTRVTPTTAASFAKIRTPNADPVLRTEPSAGYYRITGVEIAPAAGATLTYSLVTLGDAGPAQNTLASVPHHLIIDRSYIHSSSTYNLRRCVAANSAWTAVVDSWLSDCHSNDGDSQAIWGSNGPGPFTIVNNYLEGAGENVMFGGSDSRAPALMPSDITIRRNYLNKPASWSGVWVVKNLFELKVGLRVLFEANVLEGSWLSGQTGFAIVFKSSNQEGTAPWTQTADVTVRYNRMARTAAGISVIGTVSGDNVTNSTARVLFDQNLIDPVGSPTLGGVGRLYTSGSLTPPRDVVFRHNTGFGTNAAFIFVEGQHSGFVFVDNVVNGHPEYQWNFSSAEGRGIGVDALNFHAPGWKVAGNIFIAAGTGTRPANNFFPATMAEVGFVDAGGPIGTSFTPGNYRLTASSPYKGKATDGTDPGVDYDRLNAALVGVK